MKKITFLSNYSSSWLMSFRFCVTALIFCGVFSTMQAQYISNSGTTDDTFIPVSPTQGNEFCAVSHVPYATEMVQPNGQSFMGKILTDGRVTYLETIDGYTVMQDPTDMYFKYAAQGVDGDLYLSNMNVSEINERTAQELQTLSSLNTNARYTGGPLQERISEINASGIFPGTSVQAVFPSNGIRRALLLLIDYPDQVATYSNTNFNNLSNQVGYNVNGQTGSFRDFYLATSYGTLEINTDVSGWHRSINNRANYGVDDINNRNFNNAVPLIREAVDAAEVAGVDFSVYDGDGDGSVDVVMVIHSGRGAEESGNAADIWSHRWVLAANGLQVTYDGKFINDYIIQAEKYGTTNITNIGVMCHEFGHALGLPDLYDTNGGSRGLGSWCLMAGGTWNNAGRTPAHPSIYCKDELGWMTPTVLVGSGTITGMGYAQNSSESYRLNSTVGTEYFLIENRQQFGWDTFLPSQGLTIYHIDRTIGSNQDPARYRVNLEQADGFNQLNNNVNSGDAGDPFPGTSSNTAFSGLTTPNSNTYNGSPTIVDISAIVNQASNTIGFVYGAADNPPTAVCANYTAQLDASGNVTITGANVDGGSSDIEGTVTLAVSPGTFDCSNIGNNTVTLTVTDNIGQTATCTATVTVVDNLPPSISCPAPIIVNNDGGVCGAVVTYLDPVAADNCSTQTLTNTMPNHISIYSGNARGYWFTAPVDFTITSLRVPTFASAGDQSIMVMRFAAPPASWASTSSYDELLFYTGLDTNSGFIPVNIPILAGEVIGLLGVRGAGGANSYTSDTSITIDGNPVTIERFGTQNNIANGPAPQGSFWTEPAGSKSNIDFEYELNSLTLTQTVGLPSGSTFPIGTTTNTFVVTDPTGNSATCSFDVTVNDNEDPTWTNPPSDMTVECDGTSDPNGDFAAWLVSFTGTDNCPSPIVTHNSIGLSEDCGATGSETVTFTLTDASGNAISLDATFTIEDTTPPVIGCPGDVIAIAEPGSCGAIVIFQPAVGLDDCGSVFVYQSDGLGSGSVFPVGDTIIEYTAIDDCDNTSTCTFIVTVEDEEAPIANCNNLTIQLDEFGDASITADDVDGVSTDNCGVDFISVDIDTFDCSHVGDNNVTLTVTDVNGNESSCIAIVTVEDVTAPEVFCQDITIELDANGVATITGLDMDAGSSDACGIDSYELSMDSFDCNYVGDNTVTLYVTDVNGNMSSCTATVTVEDNLAPELVCMDVTIELGPDGIAYISPSDLATAEDACGIVVFTADVTEVTCDDIGTPITVSVFAIDGNGNPSFCSSTVTVVDLLGPAIVCPPNQVEIVDINGTYTLEDYIADGIATVTDNCTDPVTIFTQDPAAGTVLGYGVHNITFTAEDEYGNVSTCSFELNIQELLGNEDNELGNAITMYPNPADNKVTITNSSNITLETAMIYDISGKLISRINLQDMQGEKVIDVSEYSSGVYLVRIIGDQASTVKQLIKK